MVAIVSGNSLGLSLTSLATLGGRGVLGDAALGNTGERTYVNIATGNLVVQDQDDHLISSGADVSMLRTYNSLGIVDSDGADTWLSGICRQGIVVTGTANGSGSTLTRTDLDGAQSLYTYDSKAGIYRGGMTGAGAHDALYYDSAATEFTWTDGDTLATQKYSSTGKLVSTTDAHGNTVSYTFSSGKLTKMTMPSGDSYQFTYGSNGALSVVKATNLDGSSVTRVRYTYDASNRLATVTVDLTPADNSATDLVTYKTTYTYDGASTRLASITQSDGTALSFTYNATDFKVATVTDGLGKTTSFTYDTSTRKTTVTDPLGRKTAYQYDTAGQLTKITAPALLDGTSQVTSFGYNSSGDLTQITDPLGRSVDMTYDANGNQTVQRDTAGNTITRTFNAFNQLVTEAVYTVPDPDGSGTALPTDPLVTRYVYDATDATLVRFVVSAEGRVTENIYASGLRKAILQYSGAAYATGGLTATQVPTLTQMQSWTTGKAALGLARTEFGYDYRGQLSTQTVWAKVDSTGVGVSDGNQSITTFIYDAGGQLLKSIAGTGGVTQYAYDGLGRLLATTDALNQVTLVSYDAAANTVQTRLANNLVTTRTFDKAGQLTTLTQSDGGVTLGTSKYFYDAAGQLSMTQDPTGIRTWKLYDAAGRTIADVDATGSLVEYLYNANDQLTRTIAYATAANTALLVDGAGQPSRPALSAIRPATTADDQSSWRAYDSANRLSKTVDGIGAVTEYIYDGASRLLATKRYANSIVTTALGNAPAATSIAPTSNAAKDRVERNFYDTDGLLRGTLDGEGCLTELRYDSAGRLVRSIRYATLTTTTYRASGTLAQLIPAASASDATSYFIFNTRGDLAGVVDAEGYLTENEYDAAGNLTKSIRYASRITADASTAKSVSDVRPASTVSKQTQSQSYDLLNRLKTSTDALGVTSEFRYDNDGNLVQTVRALGTTAQSTVTARYDLQGRLTGELTAEGSALITGNQTTAEVNAVWAQYGLTHAYDAAGRRTSTIDQNGSKTLFFYNADGRLTHTVSALGEVTENLYDAQNQLAAVTRYGTRISLVSLTGASAGGLVNAPLTAAINAIRSSALDSTTTTRYTNAGRVASVTDPLGVLSTYGYNATGEQTSVTANGVVTQFDYDMDGRLKLSTIDAAGLNLQTQYTYDALSRVSTVVSPTGITTQYSYDKLGRRTKQQIDTVANASRPAPLNLTTTWAFDAQGNVTSATDPNGAVTRFAYDADNRLVFTVDALGQVQEKAYDAAGRVIKATRYATAISLAGLPAAPAPGDIRPTSQLALDQVECFVYDDDARVLATITGQGAVVKFTYDAAGNVVERRAYAKVVTNWTPGSVPQPQADDAHDERIRTVYDPQGRVLFTLDGTGAVAAFKYDAKGQVTEQTHYATAIAIGTAGTQAALTAAVAAIADPVRDAQQRMVYDAAGRLAWSADGVGAVTSRIYDANGNLVRLVQYAKPVARTAAPSSVVADTADRTSAFTYDAANRLVYSLDAGGAVVRNSYDAAGNLSQRYSYATKVTVSSYTATAIQNALTANAAADRVQRYAYDAADRMVIAVDATGAVVETAYDAAGNAVETTAYANPISLTGLATTETENNLRSKVAAVASATSDRVSYRAFDADGRQVYEVDALGYVRETQYDALDRVVKTVRYAMAVPANTGSNAQLIKNAISVRTTLDRAETFTYDAGGRVTSHTDPLGLVESWTYDATGNKLTYLNKSNFTWTYAWDAAGRMVKETTPEVSHTSLSHDANGLLQVSAVAWDALVTVLAYDALGNLVSRTEAAGIAGEERVTTYGYDALGRQVSTTFPQVGVYDAVSDDLATNGATSLATRKETLRTLTSTTTYNALGDAVAGRDLADSDSYKVYDKLGRVCFDIDALGFVAQYDYDAFGAVTKLTRYAVAIALPVAGSSGYSVSQATALVTALNHTLDRTLTTEFDLAGNAVKVTEPAVVAYDADTGVASVQASKVTTKTYNAFAELTSNTDGKARSDYYYDGRGLQTGRIDALGYVTQQTWDAVGNLLSHTEFAKAISNWSGGGAFAVPAASVGADRTTTYTYDRIGQKTSETRVGVIVNGNVQLSARADKKLTIAVPQPRLPTFFIKPPVDAVAHVDGFGFFPATAGSGLLQWNTSSDTVNVRWRAVGAAVWNSANDLINTDNGHQSWLMAADMPAGNYEVEVTYSQSFAFGGENGGSYSTITARDTAVISFYSPSAALPTLSAATATSTVAAISGVTTALRNGQQVLQWTAPAPQILVSLRYQKTGSSTWESLSVRTEGTTQYATIPAGLSAGDYQVQLDFKTIGATPQNLVTQYAYDAVGNLTTTVDAQGAASYTYYDRLGRVTATVGAAPDAQSAAPLTEFSRDAYGNAALTAAASNGAASANASGYVAGAGSSFRVDAAAYDRFGHVVEARDAADVTRYFSYNERGDLAKSWLAVENNGGLSTIYQAHEYDKLGHLTRTRDPAPASLSATAPASVATDIAYNAFGEIVSRGVAGIAGAEYWEYDNAGHLVKTNSGDGVDRVMLYDAQGRVTQELRSGGNGGGDANLRNMTQVQALNATGVRKTMTQYDKMGRVIKQTLPNKLELQGDVSIGSLATSGTIVNSAQNAGYGWDSPNQVSLAWTSIAALGSGDVKVVLSYVSQSYLQVLDNQSGQTEEIDGVASQLTRVFTAEEAAAGAVLHWSDTGATGDSGGIQEITGLKLYKKDIYGAWKLLADPSALGSTGKSVTLAAPTNWESKFEFQMRPSTSPPSGTWVKQTVANFGDQLRFDAGALASGQYDYRMIVTLPGSTNAVTTVSGTLDLTGSGIATIAQQLSTGTWAPGVYGWQSPDAGVVQTLRYRLAGSTDVWRKLSVSSLGAGFSGVNASVLAEGQYEYELSYSNGAALSAFAHATGQMSIVAAQGTPPIAGAVFEGFEDGHATVDWTAPVDGSTATAHYRLLLDPPGGAWTVAPVAPTASGRQGFNMGSQLAAGRYEVEALLVNNGSTVGRYFAIATVNPSTPLPASVVVDPLEPYTPGYTSPAIGVPPLPGFDFESSANGDWAVVWPTQTGGSVKFEIRGEGGKYWNFTNRISTDGGTQRVDILAAELPAANYETRVSFYGASGAPIYLNTTGVTVHGQESPTCETTRIPSKPAVDQEATPPVLATTFTANTNGSWSLNWNKPASGTTTVLNYRRTSTVVPNPNGWLSLSNKIVTGTQQSASFTATELASGNYELDLFYTSNGLRTAQSLRTLTISPQNVAAAVSVINTPAPIAAYSIPVGGAPLPADMAAAINSPSSFTVKWTTPAAGTTSYLKYRLHGTANWSLMSLTTSGTTQSRTVTNADLANGVWDLQLDQVTSGALTATSAITVTSTNGVLVTADANTLYMPAGGYVPGQVPVVSASQYPPLPGVMWTATAGGSAVSWTTPTTGTATFYYRKFGDIAWTQNAITAGSGRQTSTFPALAAGNYQVKIEVAASGVTKSRVTGNLNVSVSGGVATHSMVETTGAYVPSTGYPVVPDMAWAANDATTGGSTISWDAPTTSGTVAHFWFKRHGAMGWTEYPFGSANGTQSIVLSKTACQAGDWDFQVDWVANGVVTARSAGVLTVNSNTAIHTATDATARYAPAGGYGPAPGMGWTSAPTTGTKLTWTKPTSGSVVVNYRRHGALSWLPNQQAFGAPTTTTQSLTIAPADLGNAVYDFELNVLNSSGVVTSRSNLVITGTNNGNTQTVVETPGPYVSAKQVAQQGASQMVTTFSSTASDGKWTLDWNKPTGASGSAYLYIKPRGSAGTGTNYFSKISGTTAVTTSFDATELAAGDYDIDVYYLLNGAKSFECTRSLTVTSSGAMAASADVTPPQAPAIHTPAEYLPEITLAFEGRTDGTWRLQWLAPAVGSGTTSALRYQAPGYDWQSADASVHVTQDGRYQFIELPAALEPGLIYIDLAYMNGGTRVAQATSTVTVQPYVAPTDYATDSGYVAPIYHAPVGYTPITVGEFISNLDGSWAIKFQDAPAGSVARLSWRAKSTIVPNPNVWNAASLNSPATGFKQFNALASDFAAGVYEIDIYYTLNGVRTDQVKGAVTVSRDAVPATAVATEDFVPGAYWAMPDSVPSSATTGVQSFTLSAQTASAFLNFAFITQSDGSAQLQWTKLSGSQTPSFSFRTAGTTGAWQTVSVDTVGSIQRVIIPASAVAGLYDVELRATQGATVTDLVTGTWSVVRGGNSANTYTFNSSNSANEPLQAVINRKLDRWGNALEQNDPRIKTWITQYSYNVFDQVIGQTQTYEDTDDAGNSITVTATTTILYDALGRQVGVVDANGNATLQQWDRAGRLIGETRADGAQVTHQYNLFGNRTRTTNELGVATDYAWDKLGRLASTTYAAADVNYISNGATWALESGGSQRRVQTNVYDRAGRRTAQLESGGANVSYQYDLRGNVIQSTQGGLTVRSAWDALGHKIAQRDGLGATATWRYDYFGQLTAHTDLGGAAYTYTYDNAQQLTRQTNTRGQKLDYGWDIAGQLVRITDTGKTGAGATKVAVTEYSYDLAGYRIREKTLQDGIVYQDNHLGYDQLGRLRWVGDARASVAIRYDKVGNRTRIQTHVINPSTSTAVDAGAQDSDRYFQYDAVGRQIVVDAVNLQGDLGTAGHRITYDAAGNKTSDTWMGNVVQTTPALTQTGVDSEGNTITYTSPASYKAQLGLTTETYSYDALGQLRTINRDGTVVDNRYYDAAGRLAQSGAVLSADYARALNGTTSQGAVLEGNGSEIRKNIYDGNGVTVGQKVLDSTGTQTRYGVWYTGHDAAGNLTEYKRDTGAGNPEYNYTYTYEAGESYRQKTVTGLHIGEGLSGLTSEKYDSNGYLDQVIDSTQSANNRTFINDAAGRVLYANQGHHVQRQLIVNGEVLGRYGEVIDDKAARTSAGAPSFTTTADFQFGSKATGGNTPAMADTTHTVGAGDNLQALAKAYYGDSRLWYRIAEANGLFSSEELTAGQVLKIPGTEGSLNAADTFKPYEPGKVVGDTSPNVPLPKPKKASFFAQLIIIVVTIVVAIYAPEYLPVVIEEVGGEVAVAAAAAAAGNAAGQLTGIGLGVQDKFSWKQVALSAVSAGVTKGLGTYAPLEGPPNSLANVMARGAINNAAMQGIGVVTGLQKSFDWRSVAASAAGAGVGQTVGVGLTNTPFAQAFGKFGVGTVSGFAGGLTSAVMRGGKVSIQQVAIDAFGNALGTSLAENMNGVGQNSAQQNFRQGEIRAQNEHAGRDAVYGFPSAGGGLGFRSSTSDWDSALSHSQGNWSMADWKQQQVAQLVLAGRSSEAADLNASDVRMMDSGPHNFDDEQVAGGVLAKGPSNPHLNRIVEGALTKLPAPPGGLGGGLRWLGGPLAVGLELATFMKDPSTTKWEAAGSLFSHNPDDRMVRIKDGETGVSLAVPHIHNPSQYSDSQYLSYVSYKANGGGLNINDYVSFDPPEMGSIDRASSQKPEWLRRLDAGNAFNKERSVAYPYNEVYVNKASSDGYYRVDSYNPEMREIVSRKFTQFSEITERTGIDYVNEMAAKYPVGATIANVPTNVANGLAGQVLRGRQILEVPVQINPVPQSVIDAANRARVLIRDINGRTY